MFSSKKKQKNWCKKREREKREKLAKKNLLELFPSWQGIDGASQRRKKKVKKKMSHFSFALKIVLGAAALSFSSKTICGTYVCEKKWLIIEKEWL